MSYVSSLTIQYIMSTVFTEEGFYPYFYYFLYMFSGISGGDPNRIVLCKTSRTSSTVLYRTHLTSMTYMPSSLIFLTSSSVGVIYIASPHLLEN